MKYLGALDDSLRPKHLVFPRGNKTRLTWPSHTLAASQRGTSSPSHPLPHGPRPLDLRRRPHLPLPGGSEVDPPSSPRRVWGLRCVGFLDEKNREKKRPVSTGVEWSEVGTERPPKSKATGARATVRRGGNQSHVGVVLRSPKWLGMSQRHPRCSSVRNRHPTPYDSWHT